MACAYWKCTQAQEALSLARQFPLLNSHQGGNVIGIIKLGCVKQRSFRHYLKFPDAMEI